MAKRIGYKNSPSSFCISRVEIEALDAMAAGAREPIRLEQSNPWPLTLDDLSTGDHSFMHDSTSELGVGLVALAGTGMVFRGEPDLDRILSRGQLWSGAGAAMARGRPISCHENSAALWAANQEQLVLATGYAMSDDGLWRQHSWCVRILEGAASIVETTTPRLLYFGFALSGDEAAVFHQQNGCGRAILAPAPEETTAPTP